MKPTYYLVALVSLFGCAKSTVSPFPSTLLANGNMEVGSSEPNNWYVTGLNHTNFSASWSTQASSSPTHSLSITNSLPPNSTDFAAWAQTYQGVIPTGKNVILSVKIKANLVGDGLSIAIRTDGATTPDLQFATTQGNTSISGTFDWTTYNIKLPAVANNATVINVYMIYLPNTSGTVYFDDASLQVQ